MDVLASDRDTIRPITEWVRAIGLGRTEYVHGRTEVGKAKASSNEFLALLEPIRDALYRYARKTAWQADQAPDILQEAVMTAWREFGRFERGTNFKAWMFRILINSIYRLNKRTARQRAASLDEASMDVSIAMEREDKWSMLLDSPQQLAESLDERLVQALDRLATDERQCLLLRLLEGFSYKEIAAMLEIPIGTVMSHVHRARGKLRERLSDLAIEEGLLPEGAL